MPERDFASLPVTIAKRHKDCIKGMSNGRPISNGEDVVLKLIGVVIFMSFTQEN